MSDLSTTELCADLCWGVEAIAREIGRTKRQTHYLLSTGKIPAKKIGALWTASRAKLRQALIDSIAV